MINIKDIVDSAIQANIADYKELVFKYNRYGRWADDTSNKKDARNYQEMSWGYLCEFNQIKKTLVRIFPDQEQYINDKLIQARVSLNK
jgi:hypothetical protein